LKTGIEDTASLNRRFVKVKDFESLLDDISSFKGFLRNKITRILLVVVFTNLGASLGTFVAIPLMLKVLA
jgi:pheromone shutdown protein TraB